MRDTGTFFILGDQPPTAPAGWGKSPLSVRYDRNMPGFIKDFRSSRRIPGACRMDARVALAPQPRGRTRLHRLLSAQKRVARAFPPAETCRAPRRGGCEAAFLDGPCPAPPDRWNLRGSHTLHRHDRRRPRPRDDVRCIGASITLAAVIKPRTGLRTITAVALHSVANVSGSAGRIPTTIRCISRFWHREGRLMMVSEIKHTMTMTTRF
jgi:hypothetical protein